jgi:hypothetical protein
VLWPRAQKCVNPAPYIATPFLTSALVGSEWFAPRPGQFIPKESVPGSHWIGRWVGLRLGMNAVEKRRNLSLTRIEPWPSSPEPVFISPELSDFRSNKKQTRLFGECLL